MKVLHHTAFWLKITENWLYNLISSTSSEALDHAIMSSEFGHLELFPWPKLYSIADTSFLNKQISKSLKLSGVRPHTRKALSVVEAFQPDIIHGHFGPIAYQNISISKHFNTPLVSSFYGIDVFKFGNSPIWKPKYAKLFNQTSLVLCEGPVMAKAIAQIGCPESKIKIQRLGVEVDQIPFNPRVWNQSEPLNILMAGRFCEKKGFLEALKALHLLEHMYHDLPEIIVNIVGGAGHDKKSKKYHSSLLHITSKLKRIKVNWLGYMPLANLRKLSLDNHWFLSPSITASDGDTEGGAPVSIIEFAASGMPILSTTHADIPNVIGEVNKQELVAEKDILSLTEKLKSWIDNPERLNKLADSNRSFIEENLDTKSSALSLINHYQSIL